MAQKAFHQIVRAAEWLLIGLSLMAIGAYGYVALSRISYPFTIEWVEANTYLHVVRVLEGKPIFAAPSYEFVPMIYTPLYYYWVAVFARFTQHILFSMRLVSILASLQLFWMIYSMCRLRRVTSRLSIVAVGLFAASYAVMGYWLDVGRVDTLFVSLLLTGYVLALVRAKRDDTTGILAGLVVFLAFAAKQSAALVVPFLLLHLLIERRWRKAAAMGVSFALWCGLFVLGMNFASDGWFWMYVYAVPAAHPFSWEVARYGFWANDIAPHYAWLVAVIVLGVLVLLLRRDWTAVAGYALFLCTFFVPLSLISISAAAKQWGYANGLLPIVAALSVMGVEAYQHVAHLKATGAHASWMRQGCYVLISVFIGVQFGALRYDFQKQIPLATSREAGYRILARVREAKSPIFIPTSPYLLHMVQQPMHFHASSLGDVGLASLHDPAVKAVFGVYQDEIAKHMVGKTIATAVLPDADWYDKTFGIENGYVCENLVAEQPPLVTITGAISYMKKMCRLRE